MPRFIFKDIERPKRVAKNLKTVLERLGRPIDLAAAQKLVASMAGHSDWHDLCRTTGGSSPTTLTDADDSAAGAHREQQIMALTVHGLDRPTASRIVADLRLTESFRPGPPPETPAGIVGICRRTIGGIDFRAIVLGNGLNLACSAGTVQLGGPYWLGRQESGGWAVYKHHHEIRIDLPDFDDEAAKDLARTYGLGIEAVAHGMAFYASPVWQDAREFLFAHPEEILLVTNHLPELHDHADLTASPLHS